MKDNKNIERVLVVEDEAPLLKIISKKFNDIGVETVSAVSAMQALDYLKGLSEINEYPDVIWLDYYLKDSDGLTFMSELKKFKQVPDIPIIVVSNSASEDKVKGLLALGAKKYLLKAEHRLDDLVQEVKSLIISNQVK